MMLTVFGTIVILNPLAIHWKKQTTLVAPGIIGAQIIETSAEQTFGRSETRLEFGSLPLKQQYKMKHLCKSK